MSFSRPPAVEMTLAGTTYVGQILHSSLVSSAVAWGYPDMQSGAFVSFHLDVYIFKTVTTTGSNLLLVLQASEHSEFVAIDLKENILSPDLTRLNVLAYMKENPSSGVRLTFPDVPSAVEFETWMLASLLEVAAEDNGVPITHLVDLLARPEGLEYDEERDCFPALERLGEELEEMGLGGQDEELAD